MCAFHVKSPEIVTPKSLASLTNLMHSSPMTTGGNSQSDVKLRRSSLHLSVFNLTLYLIDQFSTSFIIPWVSLCYPFLITSDNVVSSTYFQIEALLTIRSFIMIKKSQGPCLVPCGTPEGTVPHSDTQPSESFILCEFQVVFEYHKMVFEYHKICSIYSQLYHGKFGKTDHSVTYAICFIYQYFIVMYICNFKVNLQIFMEI